jgi:hypothetical protein
MIKHIEGTKAGDRVTRNTPVGSVVKVKDVFGWREPKTVVSVITLSYPTETIIRFDGGGNGLKFYKSANKWTVVTPGPLPWHHRAWNWIAERWEK